MVSIRRPEGFEGRAGIPPNRKGWRTLRDAKSPVTGWKRSSLVSSTCYHRSPNVPPARDNWQSPVVGRDRAMWGFPRPSENCRVLKDTVCFREGKQRRRRERAKRVRQRARQHKGECTAVGGRS
ncbi:unnamed protein product [Sphagnum balticum]